MKKPLTIKCPAKVNLTLDILNRREDGYHNLKMIMHTIKLFDTLTITAYPSDATQITLSTNLGFLPTNEKNLCFKAARLFLHKTRLFARINIKVEKNIPVGAGLGGGSSDAAGTLLALNRLFDNVLSTESLAALAGEIGADVPFFIYGGCMLAEGIGEILTPLPALSNVVFLVAKPNYGISTPYVYKNLNIETVSCHPDIDAAISAIKQNDLRSLASASGNVLETVVTKKYPEIEQYKMIMKNNGAIYSLMSGSGSSVFGVFDNITHAENTAKELRNLTNQVYIA